MKFPFFDVTKTLAAKRTLDQNTHTRNITLTPNIHYGLVHCNLNKIIKKLPHFLLLILSDSRRYVVTTLCSAYLTFMLVHFLSALDHLRNGHVWAVNSWCFLFSLSLSLSLSLSGQYLASVKQL